MSIEEVSADGRVKVEWIYIGEGLSGDYDPEDPNDMPLMRFDAYVNTQLVPSSVIDFESSDVEDDPWAMPQDSSYCTYVREDAETDVLRAYAILIAEELSGALDSGSWKRTAEECSWVGKVSA